MRKNQFFLIAKILLLFSLICFFSCKTAAPAPEPAPESHELNQEPVNTEGLISAMEESSPAPADPGEEEPPPVPDIIPEAISDIPDEGIIAELQPPAPSPDTVPAAEPDEEEPETIPDIVPETATEAPGEGIIEEAQPPVPEPVTVPPSSQERQNLPGPAEIPQQDSPPSIPMKPAPEIEKRSSPPAPAEPEKRSSPPAPPSFLQPAEPEIPPPVRQQVPVPPNPIPELPGRVIPEDPEEQVVFSRIVRATVRQIVEIPFRGTGWVYLGELGNRRGLAYDSRRLDIEAGFTVGQSFIFIAEAAGTYILKFYKQDFIQDYIINDYVQVIVGEDPERTGAGRFGYPAERDRIIAEPRWPPAAGTVTDSPVSGTELSSAGGADAAEQGAPPSTSSPPLTGPEVQAPPAAPSVSPSGSFEVTPEVPRAPLPRQGSADDGIVTVAPPQTTQGLGDSKPPEIPSDALPAEYVRRAKQEYDSGRVESALSILDAMKLRYPAGTDEALWLYGQLLEANSPSRDVRLALETYRRLVREYPQSPRAGDAQRRIAYLERYYFNIR